MPWTIVELFRPKKVPNVWTQIEHNMCGRRTAWSPLWCLVEIDRKIGLCSSSADTCRRAAQIITLEVRIKIDIRRFWWHFVKRNANAFSLNAIVDVRRRLRRRHEITFYVSETTRASNFKIYHHVAMESLYFDWKWHHRLLSVGSKLHERVHFGHLVPDISGSRYQ